MSRIDDETLRSKEAQRVRERSEALRRNEDRAKQAKFESFLDLRRPARNKSQLKGDPELPEIDEAKDPQAEDLGQETTQKERSRYAQSIERARQKRGDGRLLQRAENSQERGDSLLHGAKQNAAQSKAKREENDSSFVQTHESRQQSDSASKESLAGRWKDQKAASKRGAAESSGLLENRVGRNDQRNSGNPSGGKSGQGQGQGEGPASFRMNPALMAPAPVARPRQSAASEKIQKLAQELAQRIAQRVMVGKSKEGAPVFQVDLKQDFLHGLSIRVSQESGEINVSFSGRHRDTLKMLEENAAGLRAVLAERGLRVGKLSFEATE